ncbi:ribonuclease HII [Salinilacihabitans rarus]|uniref:ribonuclease HII n=1 Tax=Salinilacihabitans rarus TaxID=2961596 RepID=UPI0020C8FAFA|nr:ribonuclease HII [Salinilacihabitans rarus]
MPFGVDEAGKGPALGSMFAAAVWVDDRARLPDGIADSKRLAPTRREELAGRMRASDGVRIGVAEVTPARIDDPETDMNSLAVAAHAEAIEAAADAAGTEGPAGLCDACDTDADRFARRVADACGIDATVEARHGADDEDALVGAASVIAKVERDAHVAAIAAEYDEYGGVGSGYPSDPATRAFLEAYVDDRGELPPCARSSWATCEEVLATAEQASLGEF